MSSSPSQYDCCHRPFLFRHLTERRHARWSVVVSLHLFLINNRFICLTSIGLLSLTMTISYLIESEMQDFTLRTPKCVELLNWYNSKEGISTSYLRCVVCCLFDTAAPYFFCVMCLAPPYNFVSLRFQCLRYITPYWFNSYQRCL